MAPDEHYLRAESPAEFVAQVGRIERDPALRQRLVEAGRRHVMARFSWEKIGADQEAVYATTVDRGSARVARA
jgi:glycosyltransferase involved in cell wall biosynthesis